MTALSSTPAPGVADRLGSRLVLFWAGLSVGVAFLATPAKFLAPSLSLEVALDVGRQTFAIYNRAELGLAAALAVLAVLSRRPGRWAVALSVPVLTVAAQALWLIPVLDARVSAILAGDRPPASSLHVLYIAGEAVKVLWLLAWGVLDLLPRRAAGFGNAFALRPAAGARIVKARWKD